MDDSFFKKMSLLKLQVVPLNSPTDFGTWHLALRRLVKGYGMGDALLFTVPQDRLEAYRKRAVKLERDREEREERKGSSSSSLSNDGSSLSGEDPSLSGEDPTLSAPSGMVADDIDDEPLQEEKNDENDVLLASMGITKSMGDFFSATTTFVNVRTQKAETDKESFYRQEIWSWMESSLEKGNFKWVVKSIRPAFDIHALYTRICSLANRATWISYALEFRKIFMMPPGQDIFQYHSDLVQQIKVVAAQGESLGLKSMVTPVMEQCLLLIAAWQMPQYKQIAPGVYHGRQGRYRGNLTEGVGAPTPTDYPP